MVGTFIVWGIFLIFVLLCLIFTFASMITLIDSDERTEALFPFSWAVIALILGCVVANYWLKLPVTIIFTWLKPHQWLWVVATVFCPLLSFLLVSMLPLSLFDPDSFLAGKSCGSCGRPVSLSARSGQRCPHCGAYWSYESIHKNFDLAASRRIWAYALAVITFAVVLTFTFKQW